MTILATLPGGVKWGFLEMAALRGIPNKDMLLGTPRNSAIYVYVSLHSVLVTDLPKNISTLLYIQNCTNPVAYTLLGRAFLYL